MNISIRIKERLEDILPYLAELSAGADSAKEELGFWPNSAYQSFAMTGKLLVATAEVGDSEVYVGHLMFGGLFPQAKVFQLFVVPEFRGCGIGGRLIGYLKNRLTAGHWLSIVANVADDLPANSAWEQMGFRIIRTKAGGLARRRRINVRALDLETPSLLTIIGRASKEDGLRFTERYSQRPIYLFDLNVLFDVVRKRPRSDAAARVVWASMNNNFRLMVAAEFTEELLRTSDPKGGDPVLAFASRADSLKTPPDKELQSLLSNLAPVIFRERHQQNVLSAQDTSDLKHIATAIYHRAAGFITSENAILRARAHLLDAWNLDVIGVEEFSELVEAQRDEDDEAVATVSELTLRARRNQPKDLEPAREFLQTVGVSPIFLEDALACQGTQANWLLIVADREVPLGFAKWSVYGGTKRTADVHLAVQETSPAFEPILDHLLDTIPRELGAVGPTLVRLNIPAGQVSTRKSALAQRFLPPAGASDGHLILQRLALGKVITPENWQPVRQSLVSAASLSLPTQMPTMAEASDSVSFKVGGQNASMSLTELETALSPVLFLFHGRGGVIVPIREQFARDLIGASPQLSMLSPPEAILRRERVYVSAPRTVGQLKPGMPVLFYESQKGGGRGCVFAIARITNSRVVTKADVLDRVLRRGVLDRRSLENRSVGGEVTETSFDNLFVFRKSVSLKRLRELQCIDGANLVSARAVNSEQVHAVVSEGQTDG